MSGEPKYPKCTAHFAGGPSDGKQIRWTRPAPERVELDGVWYVLWSTDYEPKDDADKVAVYVPYDVWATEVWQKATVGLEF